KDVVANEDKFAELREKEYARYDDLPLETNDGRKIDVEFVSNVYLVNGGKVIQCNIRDITERKQVERTLHISKARFAAVFQSNLAAIGIHTLATGLVIDVNDRLCEFSGWTREEVIGKTIFELETWVDLARREAVMEQVRTKGFARDAEVRLRRRNGEVRDVLLSLERLDVLGESEPVLVTMFTDITERKRSGERFRRLVESNAQGVIFWNTSGEITGANDAFLCLTGYTRADLEAGLLNWVTMTPSDYAERDRRCLEEIAAKGVCPPFEKEFIRKDGTHVPVIIGAANFEDNPEEGVCFVLDLTERKKLEQQFLRSQRMESIGTLAGGIAHDLNNVLAPIMMAVEVLKMRFPDAESLNLLDILSISVSRGAEMVRQVLSFARGVEGRRMEVQIKHLVHDIEKTVRDTFLKNIEMRTSISKDLWTVMGDPTQLHQVLLNLCVNARDAMPNGGKLTISAENLMLDAHYASLNPEAKPGPYVFIQIEDTGSGIPPGILEKIFDPFFTTKEVGKGTGLGLSTSLAIVKSHGGFLRVYSEMGKGTKFHINLPARTELSATTAAETVAEMPRGHGELILIVDDEVSVRLITQRTLETFGYRVLLASDGSESVAIYATRKAEIAAV
ncbi:MAG: PAS domain S-box protein, partial [Verrucomicrobiales bacterium]